MRAKHKIAPAAAAIMLAFLLTLYACGGGGKQEVSGAPVTPGSEAIAVPTASTSPGNSSTGNASTGSIASSDLPNFPLHLYQGEDIVGSRELNFYSLLGTRPVVLNFWASNCAPCRAEMPGFEKVWREYKDEVLFLGLDIGRFFPAYGDEARSKQELQELNITYPAGTPETVNTVRDLRVLTLPQTAFIKPDGKLFRSWAGPLTERKLAQIIDAVLQEGMGDTRGNIELKGAQAGDHWHAALVLEICGQNITIPEAGAGLHTHGDGLIHVEPRSENEAGDNATLGSFFDAVVLVVESQRIRFPNGVELVNGAICPGGKSGQVEVLINGQAFTDRFRDYPVQNGDIIEVYFR